MTKNSQQRPELEEALLSFRRAFLTVGAFSFFINLLMLTPSIYMLQVYDRALNSRNSTTLLMLTLITLGLFALMSLLEWIRSMVLVRVGARLDLDVNTRVFNATFERNLRQAGQNPAQALNDLSSMRQTLTGAGLIALTDAPWMPIYLIVIFMLHVQLGVFALIGVLLLVALAVVNERVSATPLAEAQKLAMAANAQANNHLRNAEVIEAMGMLPAIRRRWFQLHQKFLIQQAVASDRAGVLNALTRFARISMQSLALGYGALLAINGEITPGMMIAGSILVGRALAPVEVLIANWKQLVSARAAYQRLTELLRIYPARVAGMPLPRPLGDVLVDERCDRRARQQGADSQEREFQPEGRRGGGSYRTQCVREVHPGPSAGRCMAASGWFGAPRWCRNFQVEQGRTGSLSGLSATGHRALRRNGCREYCPFRRN
jgi:ATP-binding cassette subfamily C exporter for protease/lipase